LDKKKSIPGFFKIFVKLFAWIAKGMEKEAKKNNFCKS
jgi:hypothetical protein